ncbi:hypothetical protein QJQ45_001569 [Haematococcus lacustris]|nr:hypothetical protein QJQ45_001569 [Haematococcus lacustris]
MAKKTRKCSDKKHKGSCPQPTVGYVIKVPEGAVLRGCKKTRRKLREHLRLRAEIHSQPCELHLPRDRPRPEDWVPPTDLVIQRLVRPAWSHRHAKYVHSLMWCHQVPPNLPPSPPPLAQDPPAPAQGPPPPPQPPPGLVPPPQASPWGRWLDQDTNGCLNLQCIGESMQRPLELCSCGGLEALPPVGKEYQQSYKLVNDRVP